MSATDVEGIFRLSGSAKRIKDLQVEFNSPDRYGKGLNWDGYTVHDAANILRRYLNQLPEPIVPLEFYGKFRDPLRAYQVRAEQALEQDEHAKAVAAYQQLLAEVPGLNRTLLLYLLDLLAVFASKSDLNRMTAANLAAIFQPGIISHPSHDMSPNEYRLSQDVLIFLIENQDNFLFGAPGTAMDQKAKDDVKSGPPSINTPRTNVGLGRSASTASAGTDSLRRTGGVRRNASLSSRHSQGRASPNVSSPATPGSPANFGSTGNTSGLARSNTVPSNRSPSMQAGSRFHRMSEAVTPEMPTTTQHPTIPGSPPDGQTASIDQPISSHVPATDVRLPNHVNQDQIAEPTASIMAAQELRTQPDTLSTTPINKSNRDGKIKNLLAISPIFGPSDGQRDPSGRQPRKLQKRRIPGSSNESAQSSVASLQAEDNAFHTPMMTPNNFMERANPVDQIQPNIPSNSSVTPTTDRTNQQPQSTTSPISPTTRNRNTSGSLMPPGSPAGSLHSRGSVTDPSDLDALDDPETQQQKRRNRWRFSRQDPGPLAPPPIIGQNAGARGSNSSLGSNRPRKSFTGDSQLTEHSGIATTSSTGFPSTMNVSSRESEDRAMLGASPPDAEKKGFFGRMKAKIAGRDEKDRAKSPPPGTSRFQPSEAGSRSSLTAFAHEHLRGRSFDMNRNKDEGQQQGGLAVDERRGHERSGSRTPIPPLPSMPQQMSMKPVPVPVAQMPGQSQKYYAQQPPVQDQAVVPQTVSELRANQPATTPTSAPSNVPDVASLQRSIQQPQPALPAEQATASGVEATHHQQTTHQTSPDHPMSLPIRSSDHPETRASTATVAAHEANATAPDPVRNIEQERARPREDGQNMI